MRDPLTASTVPATVPAVLRMTTDGTTAVKDPGGVQPRAARLAAVAAIAVFAIAAGAPPASAAAGSTTTVFNGKRGVSKPRTLSVAHMSDPKTGSRAYDETVLRARGLRWRGWGKAKAVGRGRITFCVIEYRPCRAYRGRVEVTKRRQDFHTAGVYTYDRVRFVIPGTITTPWLAPWS